MSELTSIADVIQLQQWSRELVAEIAYLANRLSVTDLVLAALGAVALYWVWEGLRSNTRVGPIEVALLECDTGSTVKVRALTALLREHLANSGLPPPPAVPAGAPQTDLIAAVAASPVPQAAWIATVLRLLPTPPRPPQYQLTGTVFGDDGKPDCGISFWLRPSCEGRELLKSVENEDTHRDAVLRAASEIYLHISNDAVHAFPIWARWHHAQALDEYSAGRRWAIEGELDAALVSLSEAARLERGNALAQLQLANLCEQMAKDLSEQAYALRRYLDVAVEWPWLVQARYRASVLAGALSCSLESAAQSPAEQDLLVRRLRMPGTSAGSLPRRLQDLANRESEAVLQLLKPWYTLVRQQRLRYQFEPKGEERRELKRAVKISQHCLRIRRTFDKNGWQVSLQIRYSELVVHLWHLLALRGSVSWQTHYIAACFDALLLEREQLSREGTISASPPAPPQPHVADGRGVQTPSRRELRLRARAFSHLNKAIDEASGQLSHVWVEKGDPDLESLRNDDDWKLVTNRLGSNETEPSEDEQTRQLMKYKSLLPDRYPARPWGDSSARARRWLIVAVVCAAVLGIALLVGPHGLSTV